MSGPGPADASPLEFRDVSVVRGTRTVLDHVSFRLREGEVLAIVGPNGSGKTTLLRTALGLQRRAAGEIRLVDSSLESLSQRRRAQRAAWLPQAEIPTEDLTVRTFVALGRYPHLGSFVEEGEEDRKAVDQALQGTDLVGFSARGIRTLSGGEFQRVLYARALAQGAPLLLLDEPTSHLDIAHQLSVMENLRRFVRSAPGRAVLVSLHDLNLACRFADRALWLSEGRPVALGPASETATEDRIFQAFGVETEVHRRGTRVVIYPPRTRRSTAGTDPSLSRRVHVIGGGGSASEVLTALAEAGHEVSAGPLNLLDSDQETCVALRVPCPFEPPLSSISEESRAEHRSLLGRAEAVVLAPVVLGDMNLVNLEDPLPFLADRPSFLLRGTPESERDFCHGRGVEVYAKWRHSGAVEVPDIDGLLRAIRGLPPRPATGPGPST